MNPTKKEPDRLPQRLRESSFRRYESVIAKAVKSFPKNVVVNPKGSPVTFSYRLRDAMLSLYRYKWSTKTVDMDKFNSLYSEDRKLRQIHVSHIGENISIGGDIEPSQSPSEDFVYTEPQGDQLFPISNSIELNLLCLLASSRYLGRPIKISPSFNFDTLELENNFDVSVTTNVDGTYTII